MALPDLFGPITTRINLIENVDTFILSNVPYGVVRRENIQWGAIEFDGPRTPGTNGSKPLMQWHFGGVAYPITKAMRIYYTYTRTWDGSDATVTDSMLFGFQENLGESNHVQPIPWVQNFSQTYLSRVASGGIGGQATTQRLASHVAILASEASEVLRAAPRPQAQAVLPTLHGIIQSEFKRGNNNDHNGQALASILDSPTAIDFDGPAQSSDSHNVFPYTVETLFNDPDKYAQVLFWYFAGRPHRVTKAMRIPLEIRDKAAADQARPDEQIEPGDGLDAVRAKARASALNAHGLFIGYTGGTPGGG